MAAAHHAQKKKKEAEAKKGEKDRSEMFPLDGGKKKKKEGKEKEKIGKRTAFSPGLTNIPSARTNAESKF